MFVVGIATALLRATTIVFGPSCAHTRGRRKEQRYGMTDIPSAVRFRNAIEFRHNFVLLVREQCVSQN